MRGILFRGKRVCNGEWLFGGFHSRFGRAFIIGCSKSFRIDGMDVIPETVGQFTGLTDKNGTKIFEGDLLNGFQYPFYRSESDEHNYFAEVIWFPGNCAFGLYTHKHTTAKVRGISAGNADFIEDFDSDDWEVIGNIHDNPELLGGAEDGKDN